MLKQSVLQNASQNVALFDFTSSTNPSAMESHSLPGDWAQQSFQSFKEIDKIDVLSMDPYS
jgi:hypothetical protein